MFLTQAQDVGGKNPPRVSRRPPTHPIPPDFLVIPHVLFALTFFWGWLQMCASYCAKVTGAIYFSLEYMTE